MFSALQVSPMGLGTWAWGNQLLWGYQPDMDGELQEVFNTVVAAGVNIFDTADSYGEQQLWQGSFTGCMSGCTEFTGMRQQGGGCRRQNF